MCIKSQLNVFPLSIMDHTITLNNIQIDSVSFLIFINFIHLIILSNITICSFYIFASYYTLHNLSPINSKVFPKQTHILQIAGALAPEEFL